MSGDTLEPTFNIDDTEWHKIEKVYGATLPAKVRAHIVRATERFLFVESFERSVEPMAKVKVILEAHEKAATRFFNELFANPSAVSEAGVFAHYLIEDNFKTSQLAKDEAGLDLFLDLLRAFHVACNVSIKHLNDSSSTFRKGNAWANWVSRLTKILEAVHLPVSVQKNVGSTSKNNKQFAFTRFMWQLQLSLPSQSRHQTHSISALADAIIEAHKGGAGK
jgi:hypothetical protein